jgi:hypothetical protein
MILRPGRGIFSNTQTRMSMAFLRAVAAAEYAAIRPDAPPPMTMTSYFMFVEKMFTNIVILFGRA